MGAYITVNDHPTWIEDSGNGPAAVLLHGALSNSDSMLTIFAPLAERFRLVAFDRRGHGRTGDTSAPFHYADMAVEAVAVIEQVVGEPAHLVGFSDGAIVALQTALQRPDLVRSLVVIGGNYRPDGLMPGVFDHFDPPPLLAASFAERSPDGVEHFPSVVSKTMTMVATEPNLTEEELAGVNARALVLVGDDDLMTLEHTCALYESLPAGQLCVIPGTSHLVIFEKPALVNTLVLDFLAAERSPSTLMPVRRTS